MMLQSHYFETETNRPVVGRFAPSPTGRMHAGNIYAALSAWLVAKSQGGTIVLRIEDLDRDRSKAEYISAVQRDFELLGLTWDHGPFFQYDRDEAYLEAFNALKRKGLVSPCFCTRAALHAASAPHRGEKFVYPGTCRGLTAEQIAEKSKRRAPAQRLRVPDDTYSFEDMVQGRYEQNLAHECGDFLIRRSDQAFAYQLAVVVDDGLMGITQVVRGEDLLVSTPRQLALFDLLGYPRPAYMHLPLLCDPEGERLAKRHASLTLASLRDAGVSPAAVAGYLGWKAGLIGALAPAHPRNLLPAFDPGRLRFLPERVLVEADLTALLSVVC